MAKLKLGQVTAKRAYEIADSLHKKAQNQAGAMKFAMQRVESAKSNDEKAKAYSILDALERGKDYHYSKADRIKQAADKAMGRDMPLPSSDKLF